MASTKEISLSSEDMLKDNLFVEEQQSKLLSFERMGSPVPAFVSQGLLRWHLSDSL